MTRRGDVPGSSTCSRAPCGTDRAPPEIDLSAVPEDQRAAVAAVLHERDALRDINARLKHLVAKLNHAAHGKRSDKLSEDDRQLALKTSKRRSPRSRSGRMPSPQRMG